MDRDRLKRYLDEGLSLNQIGTLENRDPSTVGYWVKKYGFTANGKSKYAPRGGVERATLEDAVARGLTIREIAVELELSQSTVNHWLRRYKLQTLTGHARREAALAALADGSKRFEFECKQHGLTAFLVSKGGRSRCALCSSEAVQRRRHGSKEELAEEAGGECVICGYRRYIGALQFHHVDPKTKSFGIASGGMTRGIERAREEAKKCVLLCANCHAEVEAGVSECPKLPPGDEVSEPT